MSGVPPSIPRQITTKDKLPKPWDRRPWPDKGDPTPTEIYAAVGEALSNWETYDACLGKLFALLVAPVFLLPVAQRAYGAVRIYEARNDMVLAAAETYCFFRRAPDALKRIKEVCGHGRNWAGRRNEIAHGVVQPFFRKDRIVDSPSGYALYPSWASARARGVTGLAGYAYSAQDILYYAAEFLKLQNPVNELSNALISKPF